MRAEDPVYDNYYKQFNATNYNAGEQVSRHAIFPLSPAFPLPHSLFTHTLLM